MKSILDDQTIDIPCPNCGSKISERLGKLKTNPTLTCRACGSTFDVDGDNLRRESAKVDQAMADLKRKLGRLGK